MGESDAVRAAMTNVLQFLEVAVPDDAGLACPVDTRAQVIRAASWVDPESVREVLGLQLTRRLESSVTFVQMQTKGNVPKTCKAEGGAVQAVSEHLGRIAELLY